MKIHCPNCGQQLKQSQLKKDIEREENILCEPFLCTCGYTGYISVQKIDEKRNVITLQFLKR
jgi:C4-type Zn-finger protein